MKKFWLLVISFFLFTAASFGQTYIEEIKALVSLKAKGKISNAEYEKKNAELKAKYVTPKGVEKTTERPIITKNTPSVDSKCEVNVSKIGDSLEAQNIGINLFNDGKIAPAIRFFERAIELKSDFAVAHYYLGKCYFQQGNKKKAKEEFKTAYKISPKLFDGSEPINVGPLVKEEKPVSVPDSDPVSNEPEISREEQSAVTNRQCLTKVSELLDDHFSAIRGQFYTEKQEEFVARAKALDTEIRESRYAFFNTLTLPSEVVYAIQGLLKVMIFNLGTSNPEEVQRRPGYQIELMQAVERLNYEIKKANL